MKVTNAPYAVGSGGWQSIQAGYGAGALEGRVAGMEIFCDGGWGALTLLRLTFTAPDGTEYDLRDALTGGAAGWTEYDSFCQLQTTVSRGKVFVTADGSSATFISDIALADANSDGPSTWQVYGFDSELLAEYAASGAASNPQKEYGYRNGQLLVTAEPSAQIKWLVADHLGTPRMIFDKTGSLANVRRHDYLPFGEELPAGVGGRTTQNGYSSDTIRQKVHRI